MIASTSWTQSIDFRTRKHWRALEELLTSRFTNGDVGWSGQSWDTRFADNRCSSPKVVFLGDDAFAVA
jgi:hypothetical protein